MSYMRGAFLGRAGQRREGAGNVGKKEQDEAEKEEEKEMNA